MVHYLPHHGVVWQHSSTTKLRIVYDGSAKAGKDECSLNDCLQVGPNFIPKLFNILIKFRSHPIAITADIEKAFLMVGISSLDRDFLRFLWLEDPLNPQSNVTQFRFTRLVFGLRSSPAILGAVISHHLQSYKTLCANVKEQTEDCLYVDDLITGTTTVEQGMELYQDDMEGVSYSISPSHLLYGQRITRWPNSEAFEVASTHDSLAKKSK